MTIVGFKAHSVQRVNQHFKSHQRLGDYSADAEMEAEEFLSADRPIYQGHVTMIEVLVDALRCGIDQLGHDMANAPRGAAGRRKYLS